jgi:hypothetical protein
MRNANRLSDESGSHDQNLKERRDSSQKRNRATGSRTVSRESSGGPEKVGRSSGNKSGGSGKKGKDNH